MQRFKEFARVGDQIGDVEDLSADLTGFGFQHQPHGLADIAAMDFRPGADRHATSREVIGKQAIPLVGSQISINAGKPQAGGGEAGRVECCERLLSQKLDFAVERGWLQRQALRQAVARRHTVIDGAARQEDETLDARMPGGFEEPDAAVEIDAPEPLRIIAFAATIASGQVIESGMDDGIDPVKQVMAGSIRIERCGAKRHRPGE
jgi:hypothetical protein